MHCVSVTFLHLRKGFVIESDDHPTTFWITSPLTTMINNSAAGKY